MTLTEAQERLRPLNLHDHATASSLRRGEHGPLLRDGDLLIEHPGDGSSMREEGWTFLEVSRVAEALGVVDIDIAAVAEYQEGLKLERTGGGCPSCGHGDLLIVRGILNRASWADRVEALVLADARRALLAVLRRRAE